MYEVCILMLSDSLLTGGFTQGLVPIEWVAGSRGPGWLSAVGRWTCTDTPGRSEDITPVVAQVQVFSLTEVAGQLG